MKDSATFEGGTWDFVTTWVMAGYPHLQIEHTYEIEDVVDLQLMGLDLSGNYTLLIDIDASDTPNWNGGEGVNPIGESGNPFTGTLSGNYKSIDGLVINRPTEDYVGLIISEQPQSHHENYYKYWDTLKNYGKKDRDKI